MASPQLENGYTSIANELVDQFCKYRVSGEECLVLWVLIRKTYGWKKPGDKISLSQFADITHLARPIVARALKKLILRGVIKKDTTYITTYSLVKDYDKWKVVSKKILGIKKDTGVVSKKITKLLSKKIHTKEKKETIQKKELYKEKFLLLWAKYPLYRRQGKDTACKRFLDKVKKDEDCALVEKALNNYLNSKNVVDGFALRGSKWFGEWEDWVEHVPPTKILQSRSDL